MLQLVSWYWYCIKSSDMLSTDDKGDKEGNMGARLISPLTAMVGLLVYKVI